jgi:hypothetical protein
MEFCREGFRKYLKHYVDALHAHDPSFQIASNWAYSSYMPEPVNIGVDFISGDYPFLDCVNQARLEARCLVHQGKAWDLMAWSFKSRWEKSGLDRCFHTKHIEQLKQEAAIVLALGGGFQAYFRQKRDGGVYEWQIKLMKDIAAFCRERQQYCHKAKPVEQIALLYSNTEYYRKNQRLFSPANDIHVPMKGILQSLLDSQNVVDVTMEHQLSGRMNRYSLVVVPEWEILDKKIVSELIAYIKAGGKAIVVGPNCVNIFKKILGVKFLNKPMFKENWLEYAGSVCGLKTVSQAVKCTKGTESIGIIHSSEDITLNGTPAATIRRYGKGMIAGVHINLGERYCNSSSTVSRDFLRSIVKKLFTNPIVEVQGSHYVDVTVTELDGKLMVNLINTSGQHSNEKVYDFDEIGPVGPLTVSISRNKRPKKVSIEPDHVSANFKYKKGKIVMSVPQLHIHSIIVVE